MKERFLNIFLFLFSILFITAGILLFFSSRIAFMSIITTYVNKFITVASLANFITRLMGCFLFSWGVFFFLMTVYTVMELKHTAVYAFIFWSYTAWAVPFGYLMYINKYYFILIALSVVYGVIFLPFALSIVMKSGKS